MAVIAERWLGWFWLAVIVLWWLAAFASKRSVQRQSGGSRLLQSAIALVGVWLIFNLDKVITSGWLAARVVPRTADWVVVGAALTLVGILFAVWARLTLGSNWSGRVTIKENHELILRGPYALVRHPIYTGFLLGLLGTAIAYGLARCFVGVAIVGFAFWLKSQTEEQFMMQQFGAQYMEYRQRVRALVPFVL